MAIQENKAVKSFNPFYTSLYNYTSTFIMITKRILCFNPFYTSLYSYTNSKIIEKRFENMCFNPFYTSLYSFTNKNGVINMDSTLIVSILFTQVFIAIRWVANDLRSQFVFQSFLHKSL